MRQTGEGRERYAVPAPGRRWRPILTGTHAVQARDAVDEIARSLWDPVEPGISAARLRPSGAALDACLALGSAGLAVLFAYFARVRAGRKDQKAARRLLDQAKDAVTDVAMPPSLYEGFTGIAWATTHLAGHLGDAAGEDTSEAVDDALREYLTRSPWHDDYDLIGGLVGIGVYALERLPRPAAAALLGLVIDRLDECAEHRDEGITWHTAPERLPADQRQQCPDGHYNLGLAHGVPGVIALLGQALAAGIGRAKARRLLEGAVAWLLAQRLPAGAGAGFSTWTGPGIDRGPARSAWCYGDPGVAVALLGAARAVRNPGLEHEALALARGAAQRPPEDARVRGAGLCHGAAGLGHLFNRMYQATGDAPLREAARFWLARAVAMHADGTDPQMTDRSLLYGAPGVALALLAATTSREPAWDRILLAGTFAGKHARATPQRRRNDEYPEGEEQAGPEEARVEQGDSQGLDVPGRRARRGTENM